MATEPQTTATTMRQLKPAAEAPVQNMPVVRAGFDTLQAFELMQRAAKLLSASSLVPKDYQGNLPNCVIALNMAQRIGADPLQVMQSLYVVHGRPSWSAQFLVACFNTCGRFSAIRYRWTGKEGSDDWGCQAYATEHSSGEVIEGPVITIALAKKEGWYQKSGSKWQTIPQLMLMYRAAAWLVRTHAPEISMGLQTAEEIHDVFDARKGADGQYEVTLDSLRDEPARGGAPVQEPSDDGQMTPETVDTETGEVLEFDLDAACKRLEGKRSIATLDKEYDAVIDEFRKAHAGADLPMELGARYQELRESIQEKEKL